MAETKRREIAKMVNRRNHTIRLPKERLHRLEMEQLLALSSLLINWSWNLFVKQ